MNKYLQKKIDKYEKFLESKSEVLAKEIISEIYLDGKFEILTSVLALLPFIFTMNHAFKIPWESSNDNFLTSIGLVISGIFGIISIVTLLHNIKLMITAKKYPTLVIAREIKELIRGSFND